MPPNPGSRAVGIDDATVTDEKRVKIKPVAA